MSKLITSPSYPLNKINIYFPYHQLRDKAAKYNKCTCNYVWFPQVLGTHFPPWIRSPVLECWYGPAAQPQLRLLWEAVASPLLCWEVWAQALVLGCWLSYSINMSVPGDVSCWSRSWPGNLTSWLAFQNLEQPSHPRAAWDPCSGTELGCVSGPDPHLLTWLLSLTWDTLHHFSFAWCFRLSSESLTQPNLLCSSGLGIVGSGSCWWGHCWHLASHSAPSLLLLMEQLILAALWCP